MENITDNVLFILSTHSSYLDYMKYICNKPGMDASSVGSTGLATTSLTWRPHPLRTVATWSLATPFNQCSFISRIKSPGKSRPSLKY